MLLHQFDEHFLMNVNLFCSQSNEWKQRFFFLRGWDKKQETLSRFEKFHYYRPVSVQWFVFQSKLYFWYLLDYCYHHAISQNQFIWSECISRILPWRSIQNHKIWHFMTGSMNKSNKLNISTHCLDFVAVVSLSVTFKAPDCCWAKRKTKQKLAECCDSLASVANTDKYHKARSFVQNWCHSQINGVLYKLMWHFWKAQFTWTHLCNPVPILCDI